MYPSHPGNSMSSQNPSTIGWRMDVCRKARTESKPGTCIKNDKDASADSPKRMNTACSSSKDNSPRKAYAALHTAHRSAVQVLGAPSSFSAQLAMQRGGLEGSLRTRMVVIQFKAPCSFFKWSQEDFRPS